MPLGKGLSSLIPKRPDNQSPQPQTEDFATPKVAPDQPDSAPLEDRLENPENLSVASIAGERPKISERVENLPGTPSESEQGGKFSSGASQNFDARRPTGGKDFQDSLRKHQDAIFHIEVDKIHPNPQQPRRHFDEQALKELAASIQEFGILQPLVVSKIEKENEMGTSVEYELIAGERRLKAAKMLGWERVPAIVRKISQKSEQLELAVIENLQRENLDPIETARAYAKLQDEFGVTQREIAQRLGKSRETIANTLRLLNLSTEIQDAVSKNQINESQARLLLIIEEPIQRQNLFNELLKNNLSVKELREKVRKTGDSQDTKYKIQDTLADPEMIEFREKLTEILGADVKINPPKPTKKQGEIVITFYSPEEIKGIIEKFKSS